MNYLSIFKLSGQKNINLSRRKQIFRIMRISTFFLFFCALMASAEDAHSQKARVSMKHRNVQLETVLNDIENQTDYLFLYNSNQIDVSQNVSVNAKNTPVNEVLSEIFSDSPVDYVMEGTHIVLLAYNGDAKNAPSEVTQQSITITGKVTDNFGDPLPGVTVTIKGLQQGTATGANGDYTLSIPNENVTLVFSYIGFISKEEVVGNRKTINVILSDDTRQLEEVVVIGYGTVKKANLTGAVGYVDNKQLENRAVSTLAQALQGKVSGVNISSASGQPGAVQNINIRGYTGLAEMASPLLVIDGIQGGNISDIEINDVESISFLKDAASSAIYGSSAPYGVILVTTKKGKSGKPVITYNNNFGFSSPTNLPHYANSLDFAYNYNQACANGSQSLVYTDITIQRIKEYMAGTRKEETEKDPSVDNWLNFFAANGNNEWFDVYFKDVSFNQRHNVSASGATETSNYYIGLGYTQQDGALNYANETDQRYNARVNVSTNLTKWLTVSARTSYMRSHQEMPSIQGAMLGGGNTDDFNSYSYAVLHGMGNTFPTVPLKDPTGGYHEFNYVGKLLYGGRQHNYTDNISLTGEFVVKPLPGWDITANYTYNGRFNERTNHAATFYVERPSGAMMPRGATSPNSFWRHFGKTQDFVINAFTSYEKNLGDHYFKGQVGFVQQLTTYVQLRGSNNQLISDEVPMLSLATGTNMALNDVAWEEAVRGAFGRIQYNYKEKYLLELNGRYDGTSKYLKDKRMRFYPGVSAAWTISKESFWEPLTDYVNQLKLRASYASLGNQTYSGRYDFYPGLGRTLPASTAWFFAGDSREMSFRAPGLVDFGTTWVSTTTTDFGIDLGLLNNRLDFSFDWYRRHETDFIGPAQVYPALLGTGAPGSNNTEMETKGWDLTIGWRDRINEFSYGATLTLSDFQGTILKYPSDVKLITSWYNGKSMGELWGFETIGIIKDEKEAELCRETQTILNNNWYVGDIHYKTNGSKLSRGSLTADDPGDLKIIGNTTPRYQFGLNLNAEWKSFDATVFFQGIGKRDLMFHYSSNYFWGITTWGQFQSTVYREHDRWSNGLNPDGSPGQLPANPNGYLPRAYFNTNKNVQAQTGYLQSGAYMRVKNLQLGYTLPKSITDKIKFQKARLFINGENLFTFTKLLKITDPEIVETNQNWGDADDYNRNCTVGKTYPVRRTWSFGLNVTF